MAEAGRTLQRSRKNHIGQIDMSLILPEGFPAIQRLRAEGIQVECAADAAFRQPRPVRIAVLNLMPIKEDTETDIVRVFSDSPYTIDLQWMKVESHVSKHASPEHMAAFYRPFSAMAGEHFDGFIVTGAPLEQMEFEQVTYWDELRRIFDWAHSHVATTLYICWAAQAGLYHFHGIRKYAVGAKIFGIFPHRMLHPECPIFRNVDEVFMVPHSRHTTLRREDILACPELTLLSESDVPGVHLVMAGDGREFFVTGHSEYAVGTLDAEYRRDVSKGLPISLPEHYYRNDNPDEGPLLSWRSHGQCIYANWLKHYVVARNQF